MTGTASGFVELTEPLSGVRGERVDRAAAVRRRHAERVPDGTEELHLLVLQFPVRHGDVVRGLHDDLLAFVVEAAGQFGELFDQAAVAALRRLDLLLHLLVAQFLSGDAGVELLDGRDFLGVDDIVDGAQSQW